jgi:glutamine amidotransferase
MCELLGVSVAPAGRLGVYFNEFRPRADHNQEGWGIAWWEDGRPHVEKEPIRADVSPRAAALVLDPPASTMFIVHVRAATVGRTAVENTHPFVEKALGRRWVFAHNGTVRDLDRLDEGAYICGGDTDSERAFHHLLTRLDRSGVDPRDDDALASAILAAGRELSERESKVNFLLSDGRTLFAYHDGHKTLHFVEHRSEDLGEMQMRDADYRLSLRLGDSPEERAVIVASVPLTNEPGWTKLDPGDFLVVRDGRVESRMSAARI